MLHTFVRAFCKRILFDFSDCIMLNHTLCHKYLAQSVHHTHSLRHTRTHTQGNASTNHTHCSKNKRRRRRQTELHSKAAAPLCYCLLPAPSVPDFVFGPGRRRRRRRQRRRRRFNGVCLFAFVHCARRTRFVLVYFAAKGCVGRIELGLGLGSGLVVVGGTGWRLRLAALTAAWADKCL